MGVESDFFGERSRSRESDFEICSSRSRESDFEICWSRSRVGVGPFWSKNNAKESGVGVGGVGPFWAKGVGVGSRILKFAGVGVGSRILKFAGVGVGLFWSENNAKESGVGVGGVRTFW